MHFIARMLLRLCASRAKICKVPTVPSTISSIRTPSTRTGWPVELVYTTGKHIPVHIRSWLKQYMAVCKTMFYILNQLTKRKYYTEWVKEVRMSYRSWTGRHWRQQTCWRMLCQVAALFCVQCCHGHRLEKNDVKSKIAPSQHIFTWRTILSWSYLKCQRLRLSLRGCQQEQQQQQQVQDEERYEISS